MKQTFSARLTELEQCRHNYGKGSAAVVEKQLLSFRKAHFSDAESLIRFHDCLLFLRAFPQSGRVTTLAERLLAAIGQQVARLRQTALDADLFDDEQFSGIANTALQDTSTFEVARWLADRFPQQVSANWDIDEQSRQMSSSLPSLLPLLADDSLVEPDTPYLHWLSEAAGGSDKIIPWLLGRVEHLQLPLLEKTAFYDALQIDLVWELGECAASRTRSMRRPRAMFFHREPLLTRKQVSLADEFRSDAPPARKLPRREAEHILDMAREALTVRYRELHGSTRGDPESVLEANVGRGLQFYIWGLPPQWRLPLRAYHAGFTLKNGVPVNYFEAISLFEWVEVGFNTFYAFREGETAWIYAKLLHLLQQVGGFRCFSVYPYQLGEDNEEAIHSGAFWFYRKLGFRPGRPELLELAQKEEAKMKRNPAHRSSAATLRKLAAHHVFYEPGEGARGAWDTFTVRNLGFKVQKQMAEGFNGDAERMRQTTSLATAKMLGVALDRMNPQERSAFQNFAPLLALIPEIASWSNSERKAVAEIVKAKAGSNEADYLRGLQAHAKLRQAVLRLGSSAKPAKAYATASTS